MATERPKVDVGTAQIQLRGVRLREDTLLDEVDLDGGDIHLEAPPAPGEAGRISTGETRVRIMISEPNLNVMLTSNTPPDVPVRDLRATILSGRIRFSAQFVKIIRLPIELEAVPRIENGIRVFLDWQGLDLFGLPVPRGIVENLAQQMNKKLDLSQLPIPIWLDEIRCEPGRLT